MCKSVLTYSDRRFPKMSRLNCRFFYVFTLNVCKRTFFTTGSKSVEWRSPNISLFRWVSLCRLFKFPLIPSAVGRLRSFKYHVGHRHGCRRSNGLYVCKSRHKPAVVRPVLCFPISHFERSDFISGTQD